MRFAAALRCVALLAALCAPLPASAQADSAGRGRAYPEKSIRMIVAFSTGASHVMAVLVAEKLRESLGQPVVPDFRPGAGGIVSAELAAQLSGEVELVTSTVPATIPYIQSGRLRGLAVMAPERVPAIRGVPTTAEAGMPEVVALTWYGLFAPANVSPDVIERLNAEIVKLLRAPDARSQLTKVGLDPAAGTPAQFAKFVRAEYEKWSRVIREAKIKPQ